GGGARWTLRGERGRAEPASGVHDRGCARPRVRAGQPAARGALRDALFLGQPAGRAPAVGGTDRGLRVGDPAPASERGHHLGKLHYSVSSAFAPLTISRCSVPTRPSVWASAMSPVTVH